MTEIPDHAQFALKTIPTTEPFPFQEARGMLIDSFVDLEVVIGKWLKFLGDPENSAQLLGQRIEKLAKHSKLSEKTGKNQLQFLQDLPETCAQYLQIRNSIVHGRRTFGTADGVDCIFIQAITDALKDNPRYTILLQSDLSEAGTEIRKLAAKLNAWLNQKICPPPSSAQPSPGATADP